jgi:DNA repair protein RecN (Recombination protein N)
MLENLMIRDFILIDRLELNFHDGFSVFTGETGAGKSIFIDAISVLTGARTNTAMIRTGADAALLEGTFSVDEAMRQKLTEAGLDSDELIVTREIHADGRTVSRVNRRPVTAGWLKELFAASLDIHSQRDNQYLLNEKHHRELLDRYGRCEDQLAALAQAYRRWAQLDHHYQDLQAHEYNEAQLDLLRYQISEIDKLELKPGEEESINAALKAYSQKEKRQQLAQQAEELLNGDDGALTKLYEFTRLADALGEFDGLKEPAQRIVNAYYAIREDYDTIQDQLGDSEMSLEDIDALNQRLYVIQRIKHKYALTVPQILEKREAMQKQLDEAADRDAVLADLAGQRDEAYEAFRRQALAVRASRRESAGKLEKEIVSQLADLNLEKARFHVEFSEAPASEKGLDAVRFLISLNPGQPLRPLAEVASGGELSRLMLGLKTIFARLQGTRLLIFDEIDSGVSGVVAFAIGTKMHQIARQAQVFAVTHLAPVAAHGDQHYHIAKIQQKDSTRTEIELLDHEWRVKELAILSSSAVTDASIKAAAELLEKAEAADR